MNKKISNLTSTVSLLAMMAVPISATAVLPAITTSASVSATAAASVPVLPATVNGQLSSTAVVTPTDLNTYTSAALASDISANAGESAIEDGQIVDASYQNNGVTVEFTQPVKFLGLFPTSIQAQAVVTADGKTTVNYPWYSFLVRKHAAAINSIFQTQVNEATAGKNDLSASASATMTPQAQATVFDAIRQAIHGLRSKAAVSASASTATSASAQ